MRDRIWKLKSVIASRLVHTIKDIISEPLSILSSTNPSSKTHVRFDRYIWNVVYSIQICLDPHLFLILLQCRTDASSSLTIVDVLYIYIHSTWSDHMYPLASNLHSLTIFRGINLILITACIPLFKRSLRPLNSKTPLSSYECTIEVFNIIPVKICHGLDDKALYQMCVCIWAMRYCWTRSEAVLMMLSLRADVDEWRVQGFSSGEAGYDSVQNIEKKLAGRASIVSSSLYHLYMYY